MGKNRRKRRQRRGAASSAVAAPEVGAAAGRRGVSGDTFMGRVEAYEKSLPGRGLLPAGLWLVFALLLALPQFFGVKESGYCGLQPGAPLCEEQWPLLDNVGYATAYIADEPHYMTIVSSVINDGDLDLKNNYANAHAGGFDSGARFRSFPLNHHAYYYLPEGYRWWDVLAVPHPQGGHLWLCPDRQAAWPSCPDGPNAGLTFDYRSDYQHIADMPEYSWHPPFIPLLGYPFLSLFKDSHLLEPAAIFLSYLVTLLAAAFTYWCFGRFTSSALVRFAAIAIVFLASPVWHYSRRLLTEPYLAAFFIIAFACYFRGRDLLTRHLGGHLFMGMAMTMKSYAVLAMLPVYYSVLREQWQAGTTWLRRLLPLVAVSIGPFIGGCAVLYWHYLQNGNPLITPAGSLVGATAEGRVFDPSFFLPHAWGMLFSYKYGLLWFCPALVPAAYGWWQLLKKRREDASSLVLALTMGLPYYLFIAFYQGVSLDDTNYGPRYMVTILPLLLVGIIGFLAHARLSRPSTVLMWLLIAASFATNAVAALGSWIFGTRHPFEALL